MKSDNQFSLLRQRRFAPYFVTQLLGAFNDNVYKNALIALIAFSAVQVAGAGGDSDALLINLAAGLFILPFFLFSSFAGELADRHEKSRLIRSVKLAEIGIMALGVVAFAAGSVTMQIAILFLMGTQSAFFGPLKYAILPQHLAPHELVGGNGLVELGTFLAILAGTIGGTQLIARASDGSVLPVSLVLMSVAVAGWFASRGIPRAEASDPDLEVRFRPFSGALSLVRETAKERVVFQSILGISWFWFLGATYLAQFPVFARDVLGGSVDVFTLLLAVFSIGIGLGSGLCERLSGGRVEIGLVPFGAAGITVFGLDLVLAIPDVPYGVMAEGIVAVSGRGAIGVAGLLAADGGLRLLIDIFLVGLFGGFYIVPLYALIQKRADPARLSRAIACNNIMNALFMVVSAVVAIILLNLGATIGQLFLFIALGNAIVAAHIFRLVPEFLMRFVIWILIHTLYRVRTQGREMIPDSGAAIVVCNHVSFVDALIVAGSIHRPIRFVMHHAIYKIPILGFVFKTARAIPIAGRRENPDMYEQAFAEMSTAMEAGELLCIFPEGAITHTGEMDDFRPGILRVLEARPVPVVPMALSGLWGSLFSREGGRAFLKWPRRLFARIDLRVGDPVPPERVTIDGLRDAVLALRGERR